MKIKKHKLILFFIVVFLLIEITFLIYNHLLIPTKLNDELNSINIDDIKEIKLHNNSETVYVQKKLWKKFISELKKTGVRPHHSHTTRKKIYLTIKLSQNENLRYSVERDSEIKYEFWIFTIDDGLNPFKQIRSRWLLKYLEEIKLIAN